MSGPTLGHGGGSSISTPTRPHLLTTGKGEDQDSLRQITPEDWLLGFMRAEVDCVAVTDHNSGEWIDKLKEALKGLQDHPGYRPLYLFPGVEITANAGIHLLALFDRAKGSAEINGLLGAGPIQGCARARRPGRRCVGH